MKKIKAVKYDKIWGYEIWIYSPLKGQETTLEDGQKNTSGPLVKIIKANQPLSIQVHPDDNWAQKLENMANGKSESWYVLAAEKEAFLVAGLTTYDQEAITNAINHKSFENLLLKVPVKVGDFFDIPAGLVHGIGAGITVLEVQQPSDVTYRYYDYNRLENGKPRLLHLKKAMQVQKDLDYQLKPLKTKPLTYQNKISKQTFYTRPTTLSNDAIIVDLVNYQGFLATQGETINLTHYVVIE